MNQSEQIGELITALAKAQLEFEPALKDSDNPFFKSKYADLASILRAVRPALNKHGIAIVQSCTSDVARGVAIVRTSLHLGEQWIATEAEAPAIDKSGNLNVQTIGSAWTYLRRYTGQGICALAAEDDDGNSLAGLNDKKPAQIKAEEKWDKIDPKKPELVPPTLTQQLEGSLKLEAEKRAAAERAALAEQQGTFSIDGDVLTCKIVGIQNNQTKATPTKPARDFRSVTFNGRLPNGSNFASVFDTKFWPDLEKCLDRECKLQIEVKGQYANITNVLWYEGMFPEPA